MSLEPPDPVCPLDPFAGVTRFTRRLNETPLHLHILMNIDERGRQSRVQQALHWQQWVTCQFLFFKQMKNKHEKRNEYEREPCCVCLIARRTEEVVVSSTNSNSTKENNHRDRTNNVTNCGVTICLLTLIICMLPLHKKSSLLDF